MPWWMAATLALGVLSSGLHTLVLHLHHKHHHHHHHQNALFKTNLIVTQQTIWLWLSSWLLLEQRSVQFCCFLLEMLLLLLLLLSLTRRSGGGLGCGVQVEYHPGKPRRDSPLHLPAVGGRQGLPWSGPASPEVASWI